MYALTQAVMTRLSGDATLAALVPGGIESRPPKRTQPGATPNAFQPQPGKTVPGCASTSWSRVPAKNGQRTVR